MKKISIILASLLAALLLASCTPVSSFDTTTDEGRAEYIAFQASMPTTIELKDSGAIGSVKIAGKGAQVLPETVTFTVAEGKTLTAGSQPVITAHFDEDLVMYKAEKATIKELVEGETVTLKRQDAAKEVSILEANLYVGQSLVDLDL